MNNLITFIKKYWWIILLGFLVKSIIASVTYHVDVRVINLTSFIMLEKNDFNPYEYMRDSNFFEHPGDEQPDDLPLQYLIHLPIDFLTRPLINQNSEMNFFLRADKILGSFELFKHLFLIKLPLVLFDLSLGIVLAFSVSEKKRLIALIIWILNPVSLWATEGVGQVDIFPTFFLSLSYFLLVRKKMEFSALSLGTAAALKSFPFLIAPFLILMGKTFWAKVKLAILIAVPYVISILPYINSPAFKEDALFAPQMDKILYAKIYLSGGEVIIISVAILFVLYFYYFQKSKNAFNFLTFSFTSLLLILAVSHFHMQWLLWLTPFLIILLLERSSVFLRLGALGIGLSALGMLFLFDPTLQFQLFAPVFPSLVSAKGLDAILNTDQLFLTRSLLATVFAASSIYLSVNLLFKNDE